MLAAISLWSHALAAMLFGGLAIWQLSRPERRRAMTALGIAFAMTALWAGLVALRGPDDILARAGESARNIGYLAYLLLLLGHGVDDARQRFVRLIFIALFVIGVFAAVSDSMFGIMFDDPAKLAIIYKSTPALHLLLVIGALLLVHLLYSAAAPEARWGIRLTMIALFTMWGYDLNLYTFAWLSGEPQIGLASLRGLIAIALVPSFGFALRRGGDWRMKLSRKVTFRSLSIVAILGYFAAMYLALAATELVGGDAAGTIQIGFVFIMSVGAIVLLPSTRVRDWIRVKLAKHLFEHRYDYRSEWMRFNATLARPGDEAEPIDVRAVRAIAEITESRGGLLLVPSEGEGLVPAARWKWEALEAPRIAGGRGLAKWLGASGHILELDALRPGVDTPPPVATMAPEWMLALKQAWVLVPLIHLERLVGAVLLERPRIDRTLDWEDIDLLKIAGRQAASYLAEAEGRDALAEARRFDEFNRRFAFILHDVKNIASGLTLVARNAERHADNPAFRADMIATLRDSVAKMNGLLTRLAPNERARGEPPKPVGLRHIAEHIAGQKGGAHPVRIAPGEDIRVLADPGRLETALAHLVQNAIDASPADEPVHIAIGHGVREGEIAIRDGGCGMSEAFVRDELFRPFSSSKPTGFGIGAFEARTLIADMGGRMNVESREGAGSCFTIFLPLADAQPAATDIKMRA